MAKDHNHTLTWDDIFSSMISGIRLWPTHQAGVWKYFEQSDGKLPKKCSNRLDQHETGARCLCQWSANVRKTSKQGEWLDCYYFFLLLADYLVWRIAQLILCAFNIKHSKPFFSVWKQELEIVNPLSQGAFSAPLRENCNYNSKIQGNWQK